MRSSKDSTNFPSDSQSLTSKSANKLGVKMETQISLLEGELTRYMTQLEEAGLENAKLRQTIKMLQDDLLAKIASMEAQGIEKIEYEKKLRDIEANLIKSAQDKQALEANFKKLLQERDQLKNETKSLKTVVLDLKVQLEESFKQQNQFETGKKPTKKARGKGNLSLDLDDLVRTQSEDFDLFEMPKMDHAYSQKTERHSTTSFAKNKTRRTFAINDKEKIENAVRLTGVPGMVVEEQKTHGVGTLQFEDPRHFKERRLSRKTVAKGNLFKPKQIFEDFLICSIPEADNSDMSFMTGASGFESPAKVLWNYAGKDYLADGPRKEISNFLYPFGVMTSDCTEDLPHIEELTHRVILKEKSYRKRLVLPLLPGREDLNNIEWDPEIEVLNPNHLVYFIGIQFKDYFVIKNKEDPALINTVEASAIACFMTYYPITPLFINLVKIIITQFRLMRKKNYLEKSRPNSECDLWSSLPEFVSYITPYLEKIKDTLTKDFSYGKKLEVKIETIFDKHINTAFYLPPSDKVDSCESLWNSFLVIANLNLEDIKWLFSALLLEKKLVFISQSITYLTAVLGFMISMIKPFKYTYPMIFNLPEMLISLCDAPGAALIGLNRNEDYFWDEDLLDLYPTCTFVFLDEKKIFSLDSETEVGKMPVFQDFDEKLENSWEKAHNESPPPPMKKCYTMSNIKKYKNKNTSSIIGIDWEKLKNVTTDQRHLQSQVVFTLFKNSIEEKMLKPLYTFKFTDNEEGDFEKCCQLITTQYMLYSKNRSFLKELVQSQFFIYYYETYSTRVKAKKYIK